MITLGIVGAGSFSKQFVPLFQAHPLIRDVSVTDLLPERSEWFKSRFGIRSYASFEDMLNSDVNAIAIFTQRHLHGPLAIQALQAGKHVYSAVPMADKIEEIQGIVQLAAHSGLIYMLGETAYYYPAALFCREEQRKGSFGDFVYAEAQYYHDMEHGFYEAFQHSGGEQWKRAAGVPPMHYPTHSIGALVSATGAYVQKVSCFGYKDDRHPDEVFGHGKNDWDNPFSNETAILHMSNGGICRANEYRRVGIKKSTSYIGTFYGTKGSYEWAYADHYFVRSEGSAMKVSNVSKLLNSAELESHRNDPDFTDQVANGKYDYVSMSPIMNAGRLPQQFEKLEAGHRGVHKFLVDDFAKAVHTGKLPPNHAWAAARYNIPGIVAHQSAMRDGEALAVPDLGDAPAEWALLDPEAAV
ncbi:Gfo/Idh/MocA family protein [Paenibacillus thalictri]|uniref:Gfo/Idh/MocA family protein n=1 Tax=Paenibacillus thalictri TaxID=2527873 RepID=UPI00197CCC76|nr:Gfo/Idh/MocA family oxidoreductase [Paenibacillus thalictri]